jgi:hypothetical protein
LSIIGIQDHAAKLEVIVYLKFSNSEIRIIPNLARIILNLLPKASRFANKHYGYVWRTIAKKVPRLVISDGDRLAHLGFSPSEYLCVPVRLAMERGKRLRRANES